MEARGESDVPSLLSFHRISGDGSRELSRNAVTLFPFNLLQEEGTIDENERASCWILSLCVLTVGSVILFMISSISRQSPDTFTLETFTLGMETGISIALMFFPSSLIGVITFWSIGVRGRIFKTRPLSSTSIKE